MSISYLHPTIEQSIICFIGLLFLVLWWLYGRESIGNRFPNPLLKKYSYIPWRLRIVWILRVILFLCLLLIWIDPQISLTRDEHITGKSNVIIALDVSKSMSNDDILPNRLEKAKEVIGNFLKKDQSISFGYVIFAGRTFLLSPLSEDRNALRTLISATTTDTIDQSQDDTSGTNIGDAIVMSLEALGKTGTGKNIIILVTDGRANMGIDPKIAAQAAKNKNITIYPIGIGASSGSLLSYTDTAGIRQYFYDTAGNKITADIDEQTLKSIADMTEGRYFHATDMLYLEDIFRDIDTILSPPEAPEKYVYHTSLAPYSIIVLFITIILHSFFAFSQRRTYKS